MVPDIPLNTADGWIMRILMCIYALYAASYIVRGLHHRLRGQDWRSKGTQLIRKYKAFVVLVVLLLDYAGLFAGVSVLASRNAAQEWFTVMGLWHTVYAMTELYISYTRVPKKLQSEAECKIFFRCVVFTQVFGAIRILFAGPLTLSGFQGSEGPFATVRKVVFIGHAISFTFVELLILYKTYKMRQIVLGKDMRRTTKYLLHANGYGFVAGIADIASQAMSQQMFECAVLGLCATSAISYGRLLCMDNQNSAHNTAAAIQQTHDKTAAQGTAQQVTGGIRRQSTKASMQRPLEQVSITQSAVMLNKETV